MGTWDWFWGDSDTAALDAAVAGRTDNADNLMAGMSREEDTDAMGANARVG